MSDTRYEIFGIKINREEHGASNSRTRMYWVLRDENGDIELMTKTLEDMILEMMHDTIEYRRYS
jgi:hypothetical protein